MEKKEKGQLVSSTELFLSILDSQFFNNTGGRHQLISMYLSACRFDFY